MDILKNPFSILGATTRDSRHKIIELEEERRLLSDADECMAAQSILTHPRKRISAEVAWLPGVDPAFSDEVLRHLDSPNQNLLNITSLTHIARANLLITGLSRLPNLSSANIVEWILAIAQASEAINSETVCATLNEDRRVSGFPEITDLSAIDDEIRKQRRYYSQTLTSVLENLPVPEPVVRMPDGTEIPARNYGPLNAEWDQARATTLRNNNQQSANECARVMTLILERSTSNGKYQCPILIKDLVSTYELSVQDSLEQKKKIIEAQDEKLRAMADAKNPDTTLVPIVDQLLESVKEWDILAQPIQLREKSTGQRHDASFEMARCFRGLAADLFIEYRKFDFSRKILSTLKEVFAEVPEITEQIIEDLKALEEQILFVIGMEKFEEINSQVEKLKNASDAKQSDYTLTPMVNQLIQTVKTWTTSTQPVEANNAVAITVRNIALHLWNEHQKLDFAIQITNALIGVFKGVNGINEVNNRLSEDIITLYAMDRQRKQAMDRQRRYTIEQQQKNADTGCLLQIVIFGILGLIGALLQGC